MNKFILTTLAFSSLTIANLASAEEMKEITLGVSTGPHADAAYVVKKLAEEEKKLNINIVEFDDYITPNSALASGDLDANSFQHKPFLDNQAEQNGWEFEIIGYNFLFPMALYSQQIDSLNELKEGDKVIIQNDPTNGGRALLLLEANGIIEIDDEAGLVPSPYDILENPKNLEFVEVAAPETINFLTDAALVSINTDFVILSDEVGKDDIVIQETADSPYTNLIAVRSEDKDADWAKILLELYHTDEVKEAILKDYKDDIVLAW